LIKLDQFTGYFHDRGFRRLAVDLGVVLPSPHAGAA
jgi:hypothetical protein